MPKKASGDSRQRNPRRFRTLPEEGDFVLKTESFAAIFGFLKDDEPGTHKGVPLVREEKALRIINLLVGERRKRMRSGAKRGRLWKGTSREYAALGRKAEALRAEAQSLLPNHYAWVLDALDHLAFAGREKAEELKKRPDAKPAGRKLQPETLLLFQLDGELKDIPARQRRQLMSALLLESLGIEVGSGEKIRQRLKDFRLKPGRSPSRQV